MKKRKSFDEAIGEAYEKGRLESVSPSKAELKKYRAAAQATFIKDRRVVPRPYGHSDPRRGRRRALPNAYFQCAA